VTLRTLSNRSALIISFVEPIYCEELMETRDEAIEVLGSIHRLRLESAQKPHKQFSQDASIESGFVEHADLKLSHFGLFGMKFIIFDFGIIEHSSPRWMLW